MLYADSKETAQKQVSSRRSEKESITKNLVLDVRKSRKLQENVSTTNKIGSCHKGGSFHFVQKELTNVIQEKNYFVSFFFYA